MVKCAPKRRGYCSSPGSDFHHPPILVVPHDHPARIAGQPLRRSRGNARSVLQRGLAGLGRIRQNGGVHMDDHLVPLPGRSGVELLMQRYLGEQGQGIRLLLCHGGRFRGNVPEPCRGTGLFSGPLVQALAGRGQGLHDQRSHLRLEASFECAWREPSLAKATLHLDFRASGKRQERLISGRVMIFAPAAFNRRPVSRRVPLGRH